MMISREQRGRFLDFRSGGAGLVLISVMALALQMVGFAGAQSGATAPAPASAADSTAAAPASSGQSAETSWPVGDYDEHARLVIECLRSKEMRGDSSSSDPATAHPVRLCVLFDVSGSMRGMCVGKPVSKASKAREAWTNILRSGALKPGDTVRVLYFSNQMAEKLPETAVTADNLETFVNLAPQDAEIKREGPGCQGTIIGYVDHQAVKYVKDGESQGFTPCVLLVSDGFDDEVPAGCPGRQEWQDYSSEPPSPGFQEWQKMVQGVWHLVIGTQRRCWPVVKCPGPGFTEVDTASKLTVVALLPSGQPATILPVTLECQSTATSESIPAQTVATNEAGRSEFIVPAGTYRLGINAEGCNSLQETVELAEKHERTITENLVAKRGPLNVLKPLMAVLGTAAGLLLFMPMSQRHLGQRVFTCGIIPIPNANVGRMLTRVGFKVRDVGPCRQHIGKPPPRRMIKPPGH